MAWRLAWRSWVLAAGPSSARRSSSTLIESFYKPPVYLGSVEQVKPITEEGRLRRMSGEWREVVVASPGEVARMTVQGEPGVYVVGTGDAGVAKTFLRPGQRLFRRDPP